MREMIRTYIFQEVPDEKKMRLADLASKHELSLKRLRTEYVHWVKQFLTKESEVALHFLILLRINILKALAMLQWQVYELHLKRLHHKNTEKLMDEAEDVQGKYQV